ncbi:hypothetical protein [Vibrio harveyi]|uniref:hypothetical protein n=1 Tax=Vibrio harveyi TaxID=669 RepID=UPI003CF38BA0
MFSSSFEITGKKIRFYDSLEESSYDGEEFIVVGVLWDHSDESHTSELDPETYPRFKIQSVKDSGHVMYAYCDEIGEHRFIDVFCNGIATANKLKLQGVINSSTSKEWYHKNCSKYASQTYSLEEHHVFNKGFESYFYKQGGGHK